MMRTRALSAFCGARDPSNNRPVGIFRGEAGFFLWTESKTPEEWNMEHDISQDQVRDMMLASIVDWHGSKEKANMRRM
jgi:hypothetical protein